jgi:drug/metabolite transporter (DMT)-like permease
MTSHQKGLLLTGFGGLVLTADIPVLRLAGGEVWPVQFVRSGLALGAALLIWGLISLWHRRPVTLLPGRVGLFAAGIYGLSAIAFITAVFNTTAANVVFILAFNTMFAALLGWLVLGERPAPVTLGTMAVMICAVGLIVGDSVGSGHLFGDLAALAASFFLSGVITLSRASGKDMGFAPMIGGVLPVLLAAVMMARAGAPPAPIPAPWWLVFNGAVLIPIAFWCLATGPKYISGPEVAMFFLLETVLAPVWVWMIFGETPTTLALIGGVILITALAGHTFWQFCRERLKRRSIRRSGRQVDDVTPHVAERGRVV